MIQKSRPRVWLVLAAVLALTTLTLSSCHRDGCPNKISQVNPFGSGDVS